MCFDYGEIGHFAAKCPHKGKKVQRRFNKQGKKKSFFSKEHSPSSEEGSHNDEENNTERMLFMAKNNRKQAPEEEEEEDKMDKITFQNEMIIVVKDSKDERGNIKFLEYELKIAKYHAKSLYEKNEESKEIIIIFKVQSEEARKIEESLRRELEESNKAREEL